MTDQHPERPENVNPAGGQEQAPSQPDWSSAQPPPMPPAEGESSWQSAPPAPWPQAMTPPPLPTAAPMESHTPPPPPPLPHAQNAQFPPTPYALQPTSYPAPAAIDSPGEAKAIAWLYLAAGIYSIFHSLVIAGSTVCIWIPWIAHLGIAIWGIVRGANMISNPRLAPSRPLAICYIAMILDCDPITMTVGIVLLVLMSSPKVRDWYGSF